MSEERFLTYAEAAAEFGKSPEAIRQLAKRRRWRRVISNEDGLARVSIPVEYVEHLAAYPPSRSEAPSRDARALIALLEQRVAELNCDLKEARADLKQAQATIADLNETITDLTAKAARVEALEALLATERERVADLRSERDRLRQQAEQQAQQLAAKATVPRWWHLFRRAG